MIKNTTMEKIRINLPYDQEYDSVKIHGFSLKDITRFLSEADNGSFERIVLKYDPNQDELFFGSEEGIKFPEYGHFITKIEKSRYCEVFSFCKAY